MSYLTQFVPHAKVVGQVMLVSSTTTWAPAFSGWYYLLLIGGGGSGAAALSGSSGVGHFCHGGNAGSTVIATRYLVAGTTYTLTVGAGGAARSASSNLSGIAGTNTSVSGGGLTAMTATAGKGGTYTSTGTALTFGTYNNGDNTTPAGGDINDLGGQGGYIIVSGTVWNGNGVRCATGGGAVAVSRFIGTSNHRGGSIVFNSGADSSNTPVYVSTGGGGVRGRGGDVYLSGTYTAGQVYGGSHGGGALGPPTSGTLGNNSNINYMGTGAEGTAETITSIADFGGASGRGGVAASNAPGTPPGFGGGGFSRAGTMTTMGNETVPSDGGVFGGGGGSAASYAIPSSQGYAGNGGLFGGGGGGMSASSGSSLLSGKGGDGLIMIAQASGPLTGAF